MLGTAITSLPTAEVHFFFLLSWDLIGSKSFYSSFVQIYVNAFDDFSFNRFVWESSWNARHLSLNTIWYYGSLGGSIFSWQSCLTSCWWCRTKTDRPWILLGDTLLFLKMQDTTLIQSIGMISVLCVVLYSFSSRILQCYGQLQQPLSLIPLGNYPRTLYTCPCLSQCSAWRLLAM